MNLDNLVLFKQLDPQNILAQIDSLPDQLQRAWDSASARPLPPLSDPAHILISAVGDSALCADLITGLAASASRVPVTLHRDYGLPAFARGKKTLVICISSSGDDEETLDSFESALKNDCSILVISTGGELLKRASAKNIPAWTFAHDGSSNFALGHIFGMLLSLFARLKLINDPARDLNEAVAAMKKSQEHLRAEIPAANNPAKRYAGQLVGRWVTVMASGLLAPVARRWKTQINLIAKAGANVEVLPEANHNALAGTQNPPDLLTPRVMTLFLRAPSDHPRNRLRSDLTRQTFMLEGLNTDVVDARGDSPLAHLWTLILFGDYMAYYLAMAYGGSLGIGVI